MTAPKNCCHAKLLTNPMHIANFTGYRSSLAGTRLPEAVGPAWPSWGQVTQIRNPKRKKVKTASPAFTRKAGHPKCCCHM